MIKSTRREFGLGGLLASAFLAAGPTRPAYAAAGKPPVVMDPLALVDAELRPIARAILDSPLSKIAPTLGNLPEIRRAIAFGAPPSGMPVDRRTIPGPPGAPDVVIYVINAKAGAHRPAILHMHGGGFVGGTAAGGVTVLQEIATSLDCTIVTVDYRLAPETRWSGSVEDNYAGLLWLFRNAEQLGVDPARVALMGESAGGGHAALLAIAARDRGEVAPAFQLLVAPMLDDRTGSSRKPPGHVGQILWTPETNRFGWGCFLGQAPGGLSVPRRAVPARVENLAGLPPTFIGVGSIDLFVDEDIAYARRLIEAAVPTELIVIPGAFHGFDATDTRVAKAFSAAKLEALRKALSPSRPTGS